MKISEAKSTLYKIYLFKNIDYKSEGRFDLRLF